MLTFFVGSASAAALQITTTDDTIAVDGNCSLREAIQAADIDTALNECPAGSSGTPDTITFAVSGTITVASQLPTITDPDGLTIDGSSQSITISGNNSTGVLQVDPGASLTLNAVTVANGSASGGAGIRSGGTLTVTNSTFSGNFAFGTGGGGILNQGGTVTVTNSSFAGNTGQVFGGRIGNTGTLTVTKHLLREPVGGRRRDWHPGRHGHPRKHHRREQPRGK